VINGLRKDNRGNATDEKDARGKIERGKIERETIEPKKDERAKSKPDQRREPRRPAHGTVQIHRPSAPLVDITGRLVDISASGFRAAHTCTTLASGETIEFSHATGDGRARVVWTRVTFTGPNPSAESGFLLLE
jgi:hypothetical protein